MRFASVGLALLLSITAPTRARATAPGALPPEISIETTDDTPDSAAPTPGLVVVPSQPSTSRTDLPPANSAPDDQVPPPAVQPDDSQTEQLDAANQPPVEPVSSDTFDETLTQYGAWVDVVGLGRVWRPYPSVVGPAFRPYSTGGHWALTEYGWTFVSNWDWGWAPFHYGRWWMDAYYGWVWYPGTVWAASWVSWRYGGGFVGWAPLAPNGWTFGSRVWGSSWCFVDTAHFVSPRVEAYAVPTSRVASVYAVTATPGRAGPPVSAVAQAVGSPIRSVPIGRTGAIPSGMASSAIVSRGNVSTAGRPIPSARPTYSASPTWSSRSGYVSRPSYSAPRATFAPRPSVARPAPRPFYSAPPRAAARRR
jgi:hypothetical protein